MGSIAASLGPEPVPSPLTVEPTPVLAADDDLVSRQVLRQALKKWGYRPVPCADGSEALAHLLAPDGPRVAVLDWEMPGLDGIEVIRQVRERTPAMSRYLLLLTGRAENADIVRGLDAGADDHLAKPFDLEVLRARVSVGARMMALQRTLDRRLQDLAQAEARYRELVEGVGVAVWVADTANWELSFLNRHGEHVFGHPHPRCLSSGDLWSTFVLPDDWPRLLEFREHLLATGDAPPLEYQFRRADSRVVWLRDTVRLVAGDDGSRLARGVTQDVTPQKLAEAEREATLRMQTSFVSFASHQLRTPLTGISWMLEMAEHEEGVPETAAEGIAMARAAASRLIVLVNDLLDSARLESGRIELDLAPLSLDQVTAGALTSVQPMIQRAGHTLDLERPAAPLMVSADARYLHECLVNLLSNAAKYTPDGGRITVGWEARDRVALWRVCDTGIGIPPEAIDQLFTKFYRAPNAESMETEGTGLGLYMVRLILSRMNGHVWCESTPGVGSTFLVELPLAPQA
jgi:PAS domain S-box-containing protein